MCVTLRLIWRVRKSRFRGPFHGYQDHLALAEEWLSHRLGATSGDLMCLVADCHADATLIEIFWRLPDAMEADAGVALAYARRHLVQSCAFADSLTETRLDSELRVPA